MPSIQRAPHSSGSAIMAIRRLTQKLMRCASRLTEYATHPHMRHSRHVANSTSAPSSEKQRAGRAAASSALFRRRVEPQQHEHAGSSSRSSPASTSS